MMCLLLHPNATTAEPPQPVDAWWPSAEGTSRCVTPLFASVFGTILESGFGVSDIGGFSFLGRDGLLQSLQKR